MQVNLENIPVYAPVGKLTQRLYSYLQKVWEKKPMTLTTRDQLLLVAKSAGFTKDETWNALRELERVVDCISFWDGNLRTVLFAVAPSTVEEKLKRIDDSIWFEKLPDKEV